ncbi:MAG TPA: hypothetical protein VK633_08960, partial [Verrucomicrobiae bacterium]|nr:hypothetical protein [Verrucomicrobiae bacterium]
AFVVASSVEPAAWPQDPRGAYRAFSHRIDFESLLKAFTESYHVATKQPQRYNAMAEEAKKVMEQNNSDAVTLERLRSFLALPPRHPAASDAYGKIAPSHISYSLGDVVDFASAFDARRYLGSGWGATEFGLGVWSNGPVAEMRFRVEPRSAGPVRFRINLTAFVVKEHPQVTVHVSAGALEIAQWRFSLTEPESIAGSWHEAVIPAELAWGKAFSLNLRIEHPASPRNLGLSADIRSLGILLHRFSMSPDVSIPAKSNTL